MSFSGSSDKEWYLSWRMVTHSYRSRGRNIIDKTQKVSLGRKPVEKYTTQMYAYIILKQDVEDEDLTDTVGVNLDCCRNIIQETIFASGAYYAVGVVAKRCSHSGLPCPCLRRRIRGIASRVGCLLLLRYPDVPLVLAALHGHGRSGCM